MVFRNIDDIQPDDAKDSNDGEKKGCAGKLVTAGAITLFTLGLMWFLVFGYRGCENWRGMYISPDRVHAAYFGESKGRPVAYIYCSTLMSADDHHDYLDDSTYRVDIYDLTSGERIAQIGSGLTRSHWLGSNGSSAWLINQDTSIGLYASDVASGERLVAKDEIIRRNAAALKGGIDTAYFDAASGGALVRTAEGGYYLIDPESFAATPAKLDSARLASLTTPGDTTLVALREVKLASGATVWFSKTAKGEVKRTDSAGGNLQVIGSDYIGGMFLLDAATGRPIEPAPGSFLILHYAEEDEDAPYLLTALTLDGKVLWKMSGDALDSDPPVRAAHLFGTSLVVINDSEILYLDARTGAEVRRIEL